MAATNLFPGNAWPYVLSRHHLTSPAEHIVKVVEDVGGLHAQVPSSPYVALWNRIRDFSPDKLDRAMFEDRTVITAHLMRVTVHVVLSREFPYYFQATRDALKRFLLQRRRQYPPKLRDVHQEILRLLDKDMCSTSEIRIHLHEHGLPTQDLHAILHYELAATGLVVRSGKKSGQWRWALMNHWLKNWQPDLVDQHQAKRWLVRKYIESFGPVTDIEVQSWTWYGLLEVRKLLDELEAEGTVKRSNKNCYAPLSSRKVKGEHIDGEDLLWILPEFDSFTVGLRKRLWPCIVTPPVRPGLRPHPAPGIVMDFTGIIARYLTWPALRLYFNIQPSDETTRRIASAFRSLVYMFPGDKPVLNRVETSEGSSEVARRTVIDAFLDKGFSYEPSISARRSVNKDSAAPSQSEDSEQ